MKPRVDPELVDPILMAAWPGMGLVALKAVAYLLEHLAADPLDGIEPRDRFAVGAISIHGGIVEATTLPDSQLYGHRNPAGRDLLLFLGSEQPVAGKEWSLANELLETAEGLGAKLLYTFAAMPRRIDHHQSPRVWGCATDDALLQRLAEHDVRVLSEGSVSGLNGVLLGVAKQRGWSGCCLLGEIPLYATQMENPRSSRAVLQRVCALTGIELDLEELRVQGEATAAQLDIIFRQMSQSSESPSEESQVEDDDNDDEPVLN